MADGKAEPDTPHYHGHRERLRQRFREAAGPLPDYELLELILFHAIPRRDVKPLAKQLIDHFGDFGGVVGASRENLAQAGLGDTAIDLLKATHEAAARVIHGETKGRDILSSGQKVGRWRSSLHHARGRTQPFSLFQETALSGCRL